MTTILGLVLVSCFVMAAWLAQPRALFLVILTSTLLLTIGVCSAAVLTYGPTNLWLRLRWLPHPWFMGALAVIGIAIGAAILLGVGARGVFQLVLRARAR